MIIISTFYVITWLPNYVYYLPLMNLLRHQSRGCLQPNHVTFYVITWLPNYVYYLLMHLNLELTMLNSGYYTTVFLAFLR